MIVLFALAVLAPSPFKTIEPQAVALKSSQQAVPVSETTAATTIVETPKSEEPKPFDANDRSTWPTCPDNQVVWAQDGICHEKPAEAAPVAQAEPQTQAVPSDKQSIMAQAGIASGDYAAVDYIISHESGWRWWVKNNEGSGATGLCQALPGSKMASAGADWATNPVTQLRWCTSYAADRYGGWWGAYNFWVSNKWW